MDEQAPRIDIPQLASSLINFVAEAYKDYPRVRLDFSWPSIGILNLLLTPLKGKKDFSDAEQALIDSAAAYLCIVTAACWNKFEKETTKVTQIIKLNGDLADIVIRLEGGSILDKDEYLEVNISAQLRRILSLPENPFPYFDILKLPIRGPFDLKERDFISLFASGLFTGLCPHANGLKRTRDVQEWGKYLMQAANLINISSAEYYQNSFPSETWGALRPLYKLGLAIPPEGFIEPFALMRATDYSIRYLKEHQARDDETVLLAQNWMQSPAEVYSSLGFILSTALSEEKIDSSVLACAERLGLSRLRLLPAIALARKFLRPQGDWGEALKNKDYAQAEELFAIDLKLGLLPLCSLNVSYLEREDFFELFLALKKQNLERASYYCNELVKEYPSEEELAFQNALLRFYNPHERSKAIPNVQAGAFEQNKLSVESFLPFLRLSKLLYTLGMGEEALRPLDKAISQLERELGEDVLSRSIFDLVEYAELMGFKYSLAADKLTGDIEAAESLLAEIEEALTLNPSSVSLNLSKLKVLDVTLLDKATEDERRKEVIKLLYKSNAFESRVFKALIL